VYLCDKNSDLDLKKLKGDIKIYEYKLQEIISARSQTPFGNAIVC